MFVNYYCARQVDSTQQGITLLEARFSALISTLEHKVDRVYIVSAGEVNVLMDPIVRDFLQRLQQRAFELEFVGAACTSIHAALLAVKDRQDHSAIILALELNAFLQQVCLNAIGIGTLAGQDGLDVITGVGLLYVSKTPMTAQALVLTDVNIWSQSRGMVGTQTMLNRLRQYIRSLPAGTQVTSFAIRSRWSDSLLEGLEHRTWLDSVELDQKHRLSLKPIYELADYYDCLTQAPLLILTLGGGGRIGSLLFHAQQSSGPLFYESDKSIQSIEIALEKNLNEFYQALLSYSDEDNHESFYQHIRAAMKYPSADYRGVDNQYFYWPCQTQWCELDKVTFSNQIGNLLPAQVFER